MNKIKTTILPWTTITPYKQQEVTLNKLRIDHTWLIHRAQTPHE